MSAPFYQFNPYVSNDPDSPAPCPIAPTPTSELIERHAKLVAVGLPNCRAAQGLRREITRRLALEKQRATPRQPALANDDDHYDPDELRDDDGKWTSGGSANKSPSLLKDLKKELDFVNSHIVAPAGRALKQTGKTVVATVADWGNHLTGEDLADKIEDNNDAYRLAQRTARNDPFIRKLIENAEREVENAKSPEELHRARGKEIDANEALHRKIDELYSAFKVSPGNMEALARGDADLPAESNLKFLPPPLRVAGEASQKLLETSPQTAGIALLDELGIPPEISAGLLFGTTENGFDPKQAIIAAALPMVAESVGGFVESIASKLGVSSASALKIFNSLGGTLGMLGLINADQLREISKLPQDKRKTAIMELAAVAVGTFLVGILGGGEAPENSEPESSKTQKQATPNEPNKTAESEHQQESRAANPQKTQTDYRGTFFAAHPDLRGKVVVHHAIEQQVLNLYPGVMTDSEIQSLANLRGIPKDINSEIHLSMIRKEWDAFYLDHPTKVTKEQLLEKAREIDQKFGGQFNPITGVNQ